MDFAISSIGEREAEKVLQTFQTDTKSKPEALDRFSRQASRAIPWGADCGVPEHSAARASDKGHTTEQVPH